jgi:F-type H+-transporting ATPase subunit b
MLIDWFTVAAQALNFLILVWLLKHFLYKPILNGIDAREKGIAAQLADATQKKVEAQKEHEEFQNKNKTWDEQHGALLSKAAAEAKAEKDRMLEEAHQQADSLRAAQAAALQNDQKRLSTEIIHLTKDEVFAITRKALADLATVSLEERMGEVFTRRLREMDPKSKAAMGASLKTGSDPGIVRSTFALPAIQKAAIQNALNETFSSEVRLRFEASQENVCGIDFSSNGQKVGWSIADYLAALDQKVGALLAAESKPAGKPTPQPESAIPRQAVAHLGAK